MKRDRQFRRDLQIAIERARGFSEATVAAHYSIDPRTVRRAYKRFKDGAYKLENFDPVEVVADELARYDCAIDELATVRAKPCSDSERLRAIGLQLRAWTMQRNLLMDVGIVPRVHSREGIDAALRMEYAASVLRWLRERVKEQGLPAGLDEWLQEAMMDWIENGSERQYRSGEDKLGHEGVR
jgi:hypothetical protein